jgi:hypothetical protein
VRAWDYSWRQCGYSTVYIEHHFIFAPHHIVPMHDKGCGAS